MVLGKLDIHIWKKLDEARPLPYTKLTQNGLKTQLIYLEENTKEKYQDTGFDNELSAMSLKAQTTKANKQAYAKLTKLLHSKGHNHQSANCRLGANISILCIWV